MLQTTSALALIALASLASSLQPAANGSLTESPGPYLTPAVQAEAARQAPAFTGVRATELAVVVRVVDGVASTTVRQTLHNGGGAPAEATFLLPLPEGAVADDFRMTVDGEMTAGDVLDAGAARGVYESIVRRRRDPGLLEYYGRGCLRASVFPIPPHGDVVVEATYREQLPLVGDLFRWTFPVAALGAGGSAPEGLLLDLSIESARALGVVYSPDGGIDVLRRDDRTARASLEQRGAAVARELTLFFGIAAGDVGVNLASTRAPSAAPASDAPGEIEDLGGFFTLLLAPRLERDGPPTPRSIVFVLDTSGSMAGAKLDQARRALLAFLASLRPADRFDVVPFSTAARPFFGAARAVDEASLAEAREKIAGLSAAGGTNIEDGLVSSLRELEADAREPVEEGDGPASLPIVVFLTDGLATVGEKRVDPLLLRAADENGANARMFVFGVGDDVHTRLLDLLAERSGGEREYVRPGEAIDVKTAALFARIGDPALTDVELSAEGVELFDVVPRRMPDLYRGAPVSVVGRYRLQEGATGDARLVLRGRAGDEPRELVHTARFGAAPTAGLDFLPSLWAERQVGVLLDAIRLNGPDEELAAEVRRLGKTYRIVTPYTSHLIVEEGFGPIAPGSSISPGGVATGSGGWFLGDGRARGPGDTVPPAGGGGGGGGPSAPGPSGPSSPGPRGPGSPGASSGPPAAPLSGGGGAPAPRTDRIVRDLQRLGLLPRDGEADELERLALQIARELRDSARGLDQLGSTDTGKRAVDDSAYLAGLISGARRDESALLDLFSRRVKDRVFFLRDGVWTDRGVDALPDGASRVVIEAWSDAYFERLRARPELAAYLALSERLIVADGDAILEIRPPAEADAGTDADG